ncbi:unnamed protein product, partial [marine sediment metagenome]
SLCLGNNADIVVFNPVIVQRINSNFFYSKSKNSPFFDKRLNGKIELVIKNGKIAFDKGEISRVL